MQVAILNALNDTMPKTTNWALGKPFRFPITIGAESKFFYFELACPRAVDATVVSPVPRGDRRLMFFNHRSLLSARHGICRRSMQIVNSVSCLVRQGGRFK
jgi:hypothetical protein